MNAKRKRDRALSAVRGKMRHAGIDPKSQSFSNVLLVLDDYSREGHEAGLWLKHASRNQLKLLKRDWKRWREEARGEKYEWVDVEKATMCDARGNSIFNPNLPLGNEWELILADGRTVNRSVRYKPALTGTSYGRGWYRRRSEADALPPPNRVRVEMKKSPKKLD